MDRVHHEISNIDVSFGEHLIFSEKMFQDPAHALWVGSSIRTVDFSKLLYAGCSEKDAIILLLSRST